MILLTTESVVVVVRSPPKTGPYVVFTLDWDLRIVKVMFASFQGNTRTTNLNCSQYNEWIPAKRRKPIIWRWSIFCNLWGIVFVNVRESALFRAGALLQKCQKSYLQEMCAWLCYIKCVIGVIPNHMHCPQLLPCVFSLSLPWSFYTLPSLVKLYSEKWLPHLGIACLGVGGGVVNVFLDGCEQFCSCWSEHFLAFSL